MASPGGGFGVSDALSVIRAELHAHHPAIAGGLVLAVCALAFALDPVAAPPFFVFALLAGAWFAAFAFLSRVPDAAYDYLQTIGRAPLLLLRGACALVMGALVRYGHFSIAGVFVPVLLIVFRPSANSAGPAAPAKKIE